MNDMTVLRLLVSLAVFISLPAWGQNTGSWSVVQSSPSSKVETNLPPTLLVKGAWPSATDLTAALPEGGSLTAGVYTNQYFGLSYTLPTDWAQKSAGPPPSDSGEYVLTLLSPSDTYKGTARGSILVTAQDLFFIPLPVSNAVELIHYTKSHLQPYYQLEREPVELKIGAQSFTSFSYWSPVTDLHWQVLATDIRCHTVQFVFMNRDPKTLESQVLEMNKMKLPAQSSPGDVGGAAGPVCLKDYANGENVIERVDPVFVEHKYNPVPVRIIIDQGGSVKQIHFLSAFPDQTKAVTTALQRWKFRPYLRDGKPVEVETGILFGRTPYVAIAPQSAAVK